MRLTISGKLALAFGSLVALLAASSLISVFGFTDLQTASESLYEDGFVDAETTSDLALIFERQRPRRVGTRRDGPAAAG